ncbi:MAG TPA: hypothetical protein VGG33_22145 [Polyangia bacterium]
MKAPSSSTRRRAIAGSLTIEFVIVMPLYAVLWLSANWAFTTSVGVVNNLRETRQCAWEFSGSGCMRPTSSCVSTFMPLFPAEGQVQLPLRQVTAQFRALALNLNAPYGWSFMTNRTETLPGAPMVGAPSVPLLSSYVGFCDEEPPVSWTPMMVWGANCRQLRGRFCF